MSFYNAQEAAQPEAAPILNLPPEILVDVNSERFAAINGVYSKDNLLSIAPDVLNNELHLMAANPDGTRAETFAEGAENMTNIALSNISPIYDGDIVAEFGIGTGKVGHRIIEENPGAQYVAFELSQDNLAAAMYGAAELEGVVNEPIYYNADMAIVADLIRDGVIPERQINEGLALESLVHLETPEFEKTIVQLPKLLKDDGVFFYTDFALVSDRKSLGPVGRYAIEGKYKTYPRPAEYYAEGGRFAQLMAGLCPGFRVETFEIDVRNSLELIQQQLRDQGGTGNRIKALALDLVAKSYDQMKYYGVKIQRE